MSVEVTTEYKLSSPEFETVRIWQDSEGNVFILQADKTITLPADVMPELGLIVSKLKHNTEV